MSDSRHFLNNFIINEWIFHRNLLLKGTFHEDFWSLNWIPFMSNGAGDFICFDTTKSKDNIILFDHTDDKREILADNLESWLTAELKKIRDKYAPKAIKKFNITLVTPEKEYDFTMPSNKRIISFAKTKKINLPVSCKNGACLTCAGKILKGEVDQSKQAS